MSLCKSVDKDEVVRNELLPQDTLDLPITHKEMLALLEPLRSSLQRMETSMWEMRKDGLIGKDKADSSKEILESMLKEKRDKEPQARKSTDLVTAQSEDSLEQKKPSRLSAGEGAVTLDFIENRKIDKALTGDGDYRDPDKLTFTDKCLMLIETSSKRMAAFKEPPRTSLPSRVTSSGTFETFVQCMIILNAVLLAYSANWEMQNVGKTTPQSAEVLESCFLLFFTAELILRLASHRLYFFINADYAWNVFDFVLVSISVVDFILDKVVNTGSASNIGFIRMIRILKLGRVLRSLRLFRFLSSLSILLDSLHNSLTPLFWGLILLSFLLYLFAITFIQGLAAYLNKGNVNPVVQRDIEKKFGSLFATCFSLYSSLVGYDDWGNYYELVDKAGSMYGFLFVFFITFSSFAVFNLITGIIVEKAMASAAPNRSEQILAHRRSTSEQKGRFLEICRRMDSNGDGTISLRELKKWMQNPVMLTYMASIGLDVVDVELFFATVAARSTDSGRNLSEGAITFEHFVDGCMHMRGDATAFDMQRQLYETHVLHQEVKLFEDSFTDRLQRLEDLVEQGFTYLMHSNEHERAV